MSREIKWFKEGCFVYDHSIKKDLRKCYGRIECVGNHASVISLIKRSKVLIIYSLHTSLLLFRTEPNGALDTTIKW